MTESYKKFRPKTFKGVLGQDEAIKTLSGFLSNGGLPQAILLTGPSGTGKTTCARILAAKLGCTEDDLEEINTAESRGIDKVREIQQQMVMSPLSGKARVYILDEVHRGTHDFQSALLKSLEDTPPGVYFMLCTTDPQKLLKAILTRCTEIKLNNLAPDVILQLLKDTCTKVSFTPSDNVLSAIVDLAEGSARQALVVLDQIRHLKTEEEQLAGIQQADSKRNALDIFRALLAHSKWTKLVKILSAVEDDAETIRQIILACCATALLKSTGNDAERLCQMIDVFQFDFDRTKKAGLYRACYQLCTM